MQVQAPLVLPVLILSFPNEFRHLGFQCPHIYQQANSHYNSRPYQTRGPRTMLLKLSPNHLHLD